MKHTLDILLISYINVSFEAGLGWLGSFLFSFSVVLAHTITRTSYQDWKQRRSGDESRSDDD